MSLTATVLLGIYVVGVIACLGYIVLDEVESWHRQVAPKHWSKGWWRTIGAETLGAVLWPLLPVAHWVRRKRQYYENRRNYRRLKATNDPALRFWDASKYE